MVLLSIAFLFMEQITPQFFWTLIFSGIFESLSEVHLIVRYVC